MVGGPFSFRWGIGEVELGSSLPKGILGSSVKKIIIERVISMLGLRGRKCQGRLKDTMEKDIIRNCFKL